MTGQPVSDTTKRTIIRVRNTIIFLLGAALLVLGSWYLAFGIQGLLNQMSLIVGGVIMMLLATVGARFHWAEGQSRKP